MATLVPCCGHRATGNFTAEVEMPQRPSSLQVAPAAVLTGVLLSASFTYTQQPKPEFDSSQPAAVIKTLTAALTGRWKTREKYDRFESLGVAELSSEGEYVWRGGPGGLTLLEEYRTKTPIGELIGFGVFWWDQTRQLQHLFCANVDPAGCALFPPPHLPSPAWNGKELVLDNEVSIAGKTYAWREVITITSATTFAVTIDIGESRTRMRRWLTSQATKVDEPR